MGNSDNLCLATTDPVNHAIAKMLQVAAPKFLTQRMPCQRVHLNTAERLIHVGGKAITQAWLLAFQISKRLIQFNLRSQ